MIRSTIVHVRFAASWLTGAPWSLEKWHSQRGSLPVCGSDREITSQKGGTYGNYNIYIYISGGPPSPRDGDGPYMYM